MPEIKLDPKTSKLIIDIDETGQAPSQLFRDNPESQYPTLGILPGNLPKALRRKRAKKRGAYINFYDFGQYRTPSGLWGEFNYTYLPLSPAIYLAQTAGFFPATLSLLLSRLNAPLQIPENAWSGFYRKLEYEEAVKYRLGVAFDAEEGSAIEEANSDWTMRGLAFDSFTALKTFSALINDKIVYYNRTGAFIPFDTQDVKIKITALPVYTAPPVSFELPEKDTDIFLNPALFRFNANYNDYAGADTYTSWALSGLGVYIGRPYDCEFYAEHPELEEDEFHFKRAQQRFRTTTGFNSRDNLNYFVTDWMRVLILNDALRNEWDNQEDSNLRFDAINAMKLHPLARRHFFRETFTQTELQIRIAPSPPDPNEPPPDEPPLAPGFPPIIDDDGAFRYCGSRIPTSFSFSPTTSTPSVAAFNTATGVIDGLNIYTPQAALIAVIKQIGKTYYLWKKTVADGGTDDDDTGGGEQT